MILETGKLKQKELISAASRDAIDAGADFLKTSTGKTDGASLEAASIMLATIKESEGEIGLKVSGGIRNVAQAVAYIELANQIMGENWVQPQTFRIGASSLLDDIIHN